MIYYLHPLINSYTPTGGILKIFDHIRWLEKSGLKVAPCFYKDDVFKTDHPVSRIKKRMIRLKWAGLGCDSLAFSYLVKIINSKDVVVIPEIRPHLIQYVKNAGKKVCFVQNWHRIKPASFGLGKSQSYASLGFDYIITCGDFLSQYVKGQVKSRGGGNHTAGPIPVFTVNNSVNHRIFFRDDSKKKTGRIILLPRKGKKYVNRIIRKCRGLPFTIKVIHSHISQEKLAEQFRLSDIYIHTGFPEGFALPPLEAQACGCLVLGFTGGGGAENMIHKKTSLVSPDGNVRDVIRNLQKILKDKELKESLRENGYQNAIHHSQDNERKKLMQAFKAILSS
ncbi:MAG: glycosyltransferase family 4 protein [Spirochaetes bacterium]|nr:glycosyltransferase family 4 protein [Spirochaetota bacterium]